MSQLSDWIIMFDDNLVMSSFRRAVNVPLDGVPLTEVKPTKYLECTVHHFGNVLDKYGMEYESSFIDSSSSSFGTPYAVCALSERYKNIPIEAVTFMENH